MADAAERKQRKDALEEKRRRLEELKQRRMKRGEDTAKVKAAVSSNLDDYIDGLLSQPAAGSTTAVSASKSQDEIEASAPSQQTSASDAASTSAAAIDDNKSTQSAASNVIAEPAPAPPPKTVVTFTIGTQTEDDDFPEPLEPEPDEEDNDEERDKRATDAMLGGKPAAVITQEEEKDPKLLSAVEIQKEVASTDFPSFINTASKKVERMLGAPMLADLLVDYIGEADDASKARADSKADSDESRFVTTRQVFECPTWTGGRDVTDIDWSPLHRELFLSTYHMQTYAAGISTASQNAAVKAISPNDTSSSSLTPRGSELQSDGLLCVWNLTMPTRPEHIFTCGSPVTTGRFNPTQSPLLLGGCESGQLVVWDIRAGRLPVQKSALSTVAGSSFKGHVHPINGMEIYDGGSKIVTSSADGKVYSWSLSHLTEPEEQAYQISDSVSCLTVMPETESWLFGDENGSVYMSQLVSSQLASGQSVSGRAKRQVRKLKATDESGENFGHYGLVTSLSAKILKKDSASRAAAASKGSLRGSGGLVLSTGVDWTVKLWAPAHSDAPLLSMVSHSYDYMSDAKWCPNHPSLFATASCNGSIGLWNLASSLEEPITGPGGLVIEPDPMSGRGLNKLQWSTDGRRVAVASADRVHVLTLTEDIVRPKADDDSKMMNQLMARGLISRQ